MNKDRIINALDIIKQEINSDTSDVDIAYQIYAECNHFIAKEIKRIIKEEGEVSGEHPEIKPLYKLFDAILPQLKRYSFAVKQIEDEKCLTKNN